jgi:hypothetical protein
MALARAQCAPWRLRAAHDGGHSAPPRRAHAPRAVPRRDGRRHRRGPACRASSSVSSAISWGAAWLRPARGCHRGGRRSPAARTALSLPVAAAHLPGTAYAAARRLGRGRAQDSLAGRDDPLALRTFDPARAPGGVDAAAAHQCPHLPRRAGAPRCLADGGGRLWPACAARPTRRSRTAGRPGGQGSTAAGSSPGCGARSARRATISPSVYARMRTWLSIAAVHSPSGARTVTPASDAPSQARRGR